jgi:hypothetical protein
MAEARRSDEPGSRATRLCAAMTEALEAHPEYGDDVKGAIFRRVGEQGGLVLHAYEDDGDAVMDVVQHLQAIFEANGGDLSIMVVPEIGHG